MRVIVSVGCAMVMTMSSPWAVHALTGLQGHVGEVDGIHFKRFFQGKMDDKKVHDLASFSGKQQERFIESLGSNQIQLRKNGEIILHINALDLRLFFAMPAEQREGAFKKLKEFDWSLNDSDDTPKVARDLRAAHGSKIDSNAQAALKPPPGVEAQIRDGQVAASGGEAGLKPVSSTGNKDAAVSMLTPKTEADWRQEFQRTQAEHHNGRMGAFIRQVIKQHGGKWTHEGPFAAIAPYYSGRQTNRTYGELLQELRDAPWVQNFA